MNFDRGLESTEIEPVQCRVPGAGCRVPEVSVAGYHENFVRRASAAQRRHLSDDGLLVHIKASAQPCHCTALFRVTAGASADKWPMVAATSPRMCSVT